MPRLRALSPLALSAALLLAPLAGCGGDSVDGEVEDTGATGMLGQAQRMQEAAEAMQENAERAPAEPVNFRELRALLPESLAGLERTNLEGASQGAMGFSISQAEASYEAPDGEGEIDISIMDYGALPSMGMMGFAWMMGEVDRETSTGYEKTVTLGQHKGLRTYDTASGGGEFSLFVADRFLVAVDGENVTDEQVEAALRAVDLRALEGMRDAGRPSS